MMHKIKIFTTGGSIDKVYATSTSNFIVGDPQVANILHEANLNLEFEIVSLFKKDSLEITEQERAMLVEQVQSAPERLILITHGTDTMIESGCALQSITGKVIVLTGAMQPAAFKASDAPFNLGGAFVALQTLPEGVYLVMNGQVFNPEQARKNVALDRFEGI